MLDYLIFSLVVALVASFFYLVLGKFGLWDYLAINNGQDTFLHKVALCRLCSVFWVSVLVSIVLAFFIWDYRVLFCPFASVMISLNLLKVCFN